MSQLCIMLALSPTVSHLFLTIIFWLLIKRLIISLKFPKKTANDELIKLQTSPQSYSASESRQWVLTAVLLWPELHTELCPVGGVLEETLLGRYSKGKGNRCTQWCLTYNCGKSLPGVWGGGGIGTVPEHVFSQAMILSNKKTPWGTGYTNRTQISYLNIKTKSCMCTKICM